MRCHRIVKSKAFQLEIRLLLERGVVMETVVFWLLDNRNRFPVMGFVRMLLQFTLVHHKRGRLMRPKSCASDKIALQSRRLEKWSASPLSITTFSVRWPILL